MYKIQFKNDLTLLLTLTITLKVIVKLYKGLNRAEIYTKKNVEQPKNRHENS